MLIIFANISQVQHLLKKDEHKNILSRNKEGKRNCKHLPGDQFVFCNIDQNVDMGLLIYNIHKEGEGVMKFWAILQIVVDGFWRGQREFPDNMGVHMNRK